MKKIAGVMIAVALLGGVSGGVRTKIAKAEEGSFLVWEVVAETEKANPLDIKAKSSYLMDYGTNTVMHAQREREHLPIASMCKIMTLLLSFEAIDQGIMSLDEEIRISERAASMGGSQVFLEANAEYPVKELLKSIVVCSANDSSMAMAERVAGSESLFVERMNAKAKELGANDTLFANCTGLPKEPQYSCARDVALMLKALLSHQEYFEFGKVWLDKFSHPEGRYTEITNTNKLVRFYEGCDGGKTGFTNEAGFCLAATAKRGDMRVISVVIGEENSKNRFNDVRTMFDYAFANYAVTPIIQAGEPLEMQAKVQGGKRERITVYPQKNAYSFAKRGEKSNYTMEIQLQKLKAPVEKDSNAGEIILFKEGIETERIPLLTCEGVGKANLFDCIQNIAKKWNKR